MYGVIHSTAQKIKFSIKDFFSKCDQIRRKIANYIENLPNKARANRATKTE